MTPWLNLIKFKGGPDIDIAMQIDKKADKKFNLI